MPRASALSRCLVFVVLVVPNGAAAQRSASITGGSPIAVQSAVQHQAHVSDSGHVRLLVGGMATGALTRVSPAYANGTFTELQLVQPVMMASASWRVFALTGALDFEGYTLRRGELTPGIFGEGYVDRRHPHTFVHELMLAWTSPSVTLGSPRNSATVSLAAGKGFVPFGSDDPMMRPVEKFPVNHHHAQIIEREQGVLAVRLQRDERFLSLEGAKFNGDEPAGPFHGPRWNRVGDSWAARTTLQLFEGVQLSASRAWVTSPEIQQGGAFDHEMHHAALRIDRRNANGDARYALAEWARTDELIRQRRAFQYHSGLFEAAYGWHGAQAALRVERTDRAEQSRLLDPFRAPLGHIDFQILGITRWQVTTVSLEAPAFHPLSRSRFARTLQGTPFIEVARSNASPVHRPTVFEPADFYGTSTIWSLTAGIRLQTGSMRHRMGNYGIMNTGIAASHHVM